MATDVARLALQIDVTGAKRAQQALKGVQDGSVRLTQVTNQQSMALTGLRGRLNSVRQGFRLQKGAVQQAGYQIGDFAVQVGAGQSALVAFSQQASQLAGIMGPGGAILGAVIAVGSAIAIPLVRSMGAGEEATKSFTERLQELRDATDELTDAQVRQLKLEFKAANRERLKQITAEKENIAELREEQERYQRLIDDPTARNRQARETGVTVTVTDLRKRLKELDGQIDESRANIDTYTLAADNAAQELDELIEGTDKTGDSAEKAAEKVREMVEAAESQAATIGLSARATATYEAALAGANAEQILAIDTAFRRIEAYNQEQEAIKKTAKEEQERIKQRQQQEQALASMRAQADPAFAEFNRYADQIDQIEQFNITAEEKERLREAAFAQHQQRMAQIAQEGTNKKTRALEQSQQAFANSQQQIQQMTASVFGNTVGVMREFADEGSSAWVALTLAQKGIMAAQAIMAANLAAAMTRTAIITPLDPSSPARAEVQAQTIRFLGFADAAAIMATGVAEVAPSFAGGGFTGSGSRTGGVDGIGGFPAILHPNETVVDHTMGQGMSGGNTFIEIIDQSSGNKTFERESSVDENGIRKTRIMIRDMMREDIQKGEFDKQMQTSFGVRRRARRV